MHSEYINGLAGIKTMSEEVLGMEAAQLDETIEDINEALSADNFYEGDRREVTRSREFFASRRASVERALAERSITSAGRAI